MAPRFSDRQVIKALTLLAVGKVTEAERDICDVIAFDPESSIAHFAHAQILGALERHEEALAALDRANLVENPQWHACRATHLSKAGQHAEALVASEEAVRLDPQNPLCWYRKGAATVRAGQCTGRKKLIREGKASLIRACELDPDFYMSRIDLAALHLSEGNRAAAVLIDEALQLKFGDPRVHQLAAQAALLGGRIDEAESHASLVIAARPDSRAAMALMRNIARSKQSRIYRGLVRGSWFLRRATPFGGHWILGGALGLGLALFGATLVQLELAICFGAMTLAAWLVWERRGLDHILKRPQLKRDF